MTTLLRTRSLLPTLPRALPQPYQKRTFIPGLSSLPSLSSLTSNSPLHFHANRVLPYPQSSLFSIISDINAYPTFIPGLLDAEILEYTYPRPHQEIQTPQPWLASLTVGLDDIAKLGLPMSKAAFISRVYCVPQRGIVEAVAGEESDSKEFTLEELGKYGYGGAFGVGFLGEDAGKELFKACRTRWKLRDAGSGRTEVDLKIEIEWKNALLAGVTQAAAPRMAEAVVKAFEGRARDLLKGK